MPRKNILYAEIREFKDQLTLALSKFSRLFMLFDKFSDWKDPEKQVVLSNTRPCIERIWSKVAANTKVTINLMIEREKRKVSNVGAKSLALEFLRNICSFLLGEGLSHSSL